MTDNNAFLDHITATLAGIEADGLMKRERLITGAKARMSQMAGRQMLNLCANNYLGLADDPRLIAAAKAAMDDHGFGMASVRFICGTQDLHRELETASGPVPRPGRRDPLRRLFRRQRRAVRAAARPGRRRHLGRSEPRLDHRRHPPVQGEALPLRQFRHGRPRDPAEGGPRRRRPLHPDRHRRRLLDGRLSRQPAGDPRAGRPLRRAGHGRRLPRHRLHRARRAAAPRRTPGSRSTS